MAETPASFSAYESAAPFDHTWEDRFLGERGMGHWITAKPNRLILIGKAAWHMINRIDADAGDNIRCSITAFFLPRNCHVE